MYLGIGQAYYVNNGATIAGIGTSSPDGWVWKTANEEAPEIAKAMKDNTTIMDTLLKLPGMKSMLAIKAGVQMNKTVLSVMTQMRNITTAVMFATANGHIGKGASVADNFITPIKYRKMLC